MLQLHQILLPHQQRKGFRTGSCSSRWHYREVLLTFRDDSMAVAGQAGTWHDSTSPSAYFGGSKLNKKCLKYFWMVIGLYSQSAFLVLATTQSALQHKSAINHSHTGDRGYHARCHLLIKRDNHSCMRTPMEEPQGEIWGSLSCQRILWLVLQGPGIEPPTFWLKGNCCCENELLWTINTLILLQIKLCSKKLTKNQKNEFSVLHFLLCTVPANTSGTCTSTGFMSEYILFVFVVVSVSVNGSARPPYWATCRLTLPIKALNT